MLSQEGNTLSSSSAFFSRAENEAVQLLAKATDLLAKCTDYEATLECIADLLVSSLANWCTIDLLNEEGKLERAAVTHRDPTKADITKRMLVKYPAKPGIKRGVYKVIETGESILIPSASESMWALRADSAEHLKMILELGSTSYMCVPLKARGRVVGSIMLLSGERIYDEIDLQTAEQLARCIAMAVDNVQMFRKMQSAQAQLLQSAKMAALGVMSAGIAHEINNPLTIIKGHLKIFENHLEKKENPAREEFQSYSEKINRNIDRIVNIVQHVKEFSRQSHAELKTLSLEKLVESSLTLFEQQFFLSDIKVHKSFPQISPTVLGDFNRLEQVLVNIFVNAKDAIKARPNMDGGNIRIRISIQAHNQKAKITIQDDGIGIQSELQEHVFEPFFTTKDVGQGTGLGLSISHGIIKDHGGHIEFHSEKNKGTQLVIELPTADL